MIPVVTVSEMRELDEHAHREVGLQVLVERAGYAVTRYALEMLHGGYGHRVLVIAGKGNNGEDGRVAARILRDRGAIVEVVAPPELQQPMQQFDLVIDAAYGTGFHGTYEPPAIPEGVPVLAVDIPSGVHGDTGEASGHPLQADATVVMAAMKPGLLQGDGARLAGKLHLADIGIDASRHADIFLVEDGDVSLYLPERGRDAHKWESAVCIVAGSPGMTGAASMCAKGALRSGAGMVRLMSASPAPSGPAPAGSTLLDLHVPEVVSIALDAHQDWSRQVLDESARCRSAVIGPGAGRSPETAREIRKLVKDLSIPMVLDADGLYALGTGEEAAALLNGRNHEHLDADRPVPPVILTPHDGEAARLAGHPIGANRIKETRRLARFLGATVLLKGSTTVVAEPDGHAYVVTSGSPRLATAGTGDVLTGMIGAFLARGAGTLPAMAAALAAHVHGRASWLGRSTGLTAMDLPDLVADWLSSLANSMGPG
ncbi:MAG: NAD(P)H-hydrate dehydratase [Actinobacteria bacterium]|jgi:NAD(P)H-hydrate epimerase|nr:NAD(P)H-hydrate dehydratase [Actinomycetota bacterium]